MLNALRYSMCFLNVYVLRRYSLISSPVLALSSKRKVSIPMPLSQSLFPSHLKNRSYFFYLASILLLLPSLLLLLLISSNSNRSLPFSLHSNTHSLLSPSPISDGVSIDKSRPSHPPDLSLLPPPPQEPPPISATETVSGDIGDEASIENRRSQSQEPPPPPPTISKIEPVAKPDPATDEIDDLSHLMNQPSRAPPQELPPISEAEGVAGTRPDAEIGENAKCNLYQGRWEKDEEGRYPLYAPRSCPFVDDAFTCQENGRSDGDYTKWRWKPNDCELPRFNATDFLERLRSKSLMLVGDSMNRNQFESILCLLREALSNKSKVYETQGHKVSKGRGYFNFLFEDYNCTVEFIQSHFLARQGTRVNGQGDRNPILEIDRIDKSAKRWKKANILVFNTGHWWNHGKTSRGKNYFKEGGVVYPQFDALEAFKRALKTWGKWIDENINHKETLVFYRGYSAAHFRGGDWDSGGSCKGEIEPALTGSIIDSYPVKMKIVDGVISEMKSPVVVLNVTKLTNFRKDGHPSIYGGKSVAPGQKVTGRKQDCSHWCLPGVPDTWNELIYATLVSRQP